MQLHAMWDEYPALSKDLQEVLQTIEKIFKFAINTLSKM